MVLWKFAAPENRRSRVADCPPFDLTCEFAQNPVGVDSRAPLLGWRCRSSRRGGRQSAWQVLASASEETLRLGEGELWNSGKIDGTENARNTAAQCSGVPWAGAPLTSSQRVYWKVQIWDENGRTEGYSSAAFFEMGLLSPSDWKGRWMGFLGGLHGQGILMRRAFTCPKKPARARAYVSGLGYYELHLNGKRVGDKLLDPGATDYSRTILYSSYDVTEHLREGSNVVGAILGNGWYGSPRLLLQLNFEYADGGTGEIHTDWGDGWYVAESPIVYNSLYDGEDYDARREKDGWDSPEYDFASVHQRPGGWILATIVENPGGRMVSEIMEPIGVTDELDPKLLHTLPDGSAIYDAGVNIAGWVRMKVLGERGAKVSLKFAEVLHDDGTLDTDNLRLARAADTYILRGLGAGEEYAPRFTYHGFRYFRLETSGRVKIVRLTVQVARSMVRRNVQFSCSDPFLNRLAEMMWLTDANNMYSIPTDCCQRDERQGWVNDATVRVEGSSYHFDVSRFYEKWLRDIFDTQSPAGYIADTAPHRWGFNPCDPHVNTPICLPLLLYRVYGNRRVLELSYDAQKRYIAALQGESQGYVIYRSRCGEWASPAGECYPEKDGAVAVSRHTPGALVSTAYFYLDAVQMTRIAALLGKDEDVEYFTGLADKIREAYNQTFYNAETCQYHTGSQGSNALSVNLGLVPPGQAQKVVDNIQADIVARDYHLSTGSQATKHMMEALSRYGRQDTALRVMTQTTYPSFGYMMEKGATTIWERWEADRSNNIMNSRNQPMHGSVCTWFYKCIGGVRPADDAAGFDRFIVAPSIPRGLTHAQISLLTVRGEVRVSWRKTGTELHLSVTVPFNTSAEVHVPFDGGHADAPHRPELSESGRLLFDSRTGVHPVDGITDVALEEAGLVLHTGSGEFDFLLRDSTV